MSISKHKRLALALPLLGLSTAATASGLEYNYAELGTSFTKTQFNIAGQRPVFSGKSLNATVQYIPSDGIYLKGLFSRLSVNDHDRIINTKYTVDGSSTTFGGVLGAYRSLKENVDIRGGIGLINEKTNYGFTYQLKNKELVLKQDFNSINPYFELGLKVDFEEWGDLDLLLSRYNSATYFTIGGNAPITENIGIEIGYTFSPSGKERERLGAWNLEMRYYF